MEPYCKVLPRSQNMSSLSKGRWPLLSWSKTISSEAWASWSLTDVCKSLSCLNLTRRKRACLPLKASNFYISCWHATAAVPLSNMTMQTHGPVMRCVESTCPTVQTPLAGSTQHSNSSVSCRDTPYMHTSVSVIETEPD